MSVHRIFQARLIDLPREMTFYETGFKAAEFNFQ